MITLHPIASQTAHVRRTTSPKVSTVPVFFGRSHEPLELNNGLNHQYPSIMSYYQAFKESSYPDKINLLLGINPFAVPETVQSLKSHATETVAAPYGGITELKSAISDLYKNQLHINPDQIYVSTGSRALLDPLFRVLQGDVLLLEPAWPEYRPFAERSGKKVYKVKPNEDYVPSKNDLERAFSKSKAKAQILIINNPNNPTGVNLNKEQLQVIVDFCRKHGITIVSDECQIVYPGVKFTNIASLYPEGTIIISNGPSKALGVGGYSIGWSALPAGEKGKAILEALKKYSPSDPATPIQWAVAQSLRTPAAIEHINKSTAFHQARTQSLYEQLQSIGVDGPRPEATFNMLVSFKKYKSALQKLGVHNDDELQKYLLKNYGLGTVPGYVFGISQFDYNLRLSTSALDQHAFNHWMDTGAPSPIQINRENHPQMFSAVDRLQSFVSLLEKQK
jgi:aspartate/methionine/tyrosine aminotransferase